MAETEVLVVGRLELAEALELLVKERLAETEAHTLNTWALVEVAVLRWALVVVETVELT
jgi:hypothetical protein